MRADYDLVIIGDSYLARWAALTAARQYARVAYIVQYPAAQPGLPLVMQTLADRMASLPSETHSPHFKTTAALSEWIVESGRSYLRSYSFNRLSHHGVDVIETPGAFVKTQFKTPCFAVPNRQLRSRSYLLALPQADGDLNHFLKQLDTLPVQTQVHVDCRQPWAIALGQALNQLGYPITLVRQEQLLPTEDSDTSFFVQCALEAEGIKVQHQAPPASELSSPLDKGDAATVVSEDSVLFSPRLDINLASLKLETIGINTYPTAPHLTVSPTFQTQKPSIYACGPVLGGYSSDEIGRQEAAIALQNALFQANQPQQYHRWPYRLPIGFGFCRIGLTEAQARRKFSQPEVLKRTVDDHGTPLFCKLIATAAGEVVGLHLVGDAAISAVSSLEQILVNRLSVSQLNQVTLNHDLLREVFQDFAVRWNQIKHPQMRDRHEQYFRAKRKRFS